MGQLPQEACCQCPGDDISVLWALGEFVVKADEHDISPLVFPHSDIKRMRWLDTLMMCCSVWWSPNRQPFSAAKYCLSQE